MQLKAQPHVCLEGAPVGGAAGDVASLGTCFAASAMLKRFIFMGWKHSEH
jgi:hypothetical protein